VIRANQVCKSFGSTKVLDNVTVEVPRGKVLGIVGVGGGGKSVLLKLLCGLLQPDSGNVIVDGADLATLDELDMAQLRDRFGLLFQNNALFDFMTVGENVAFPLVQRGEMAIEEINALVDSRLASVDLPGTQSLFPNQLSGGMRKRVALARATIASAPILIYDDPTAGLDPVTSSKIFGLIRTLHNPEGATVVVGHDIDRMLPVCDTWVLIHESSVLFAGDTEAALACNDSIVKTYFHGGADPA